MKHNTKILNKKEYMTDEEFKNYLIGEINLLEKEYQYILDYSFKKYDRFSRYLDNNKVNNCKKKLRSLEKEADSLYGFESIKYDNYSYEIIKIDYKYGINVYDLVCELKWEEDINKRYEILKKIKKIYRNLFIELNENRVENKKGIKKVYSLLYFFKEKYKLTKNKVENQKRREKEEKKKLLEEKEEKSEEKTYTFYNIENCDLKELLELYRDSMIDGKIDNEAVINLQIIIRRMVNMELDDEHLKLLYSISDMIKYRKQKLYDEEMIERRILNICHSSIDKFLELNSLLHMEDIEPHDYRFEIVFELLKDKNNYSSIKSLVKKYPQIVNVRNEKKSILIYILTLYLNNYKMILQDHRYYYNVDYLKEVYRLFANSNSLYLSFEEEKIIDDLISKYIIEIDEMDISSKKKSYAINEAVELNIDKIKKEKNYTKNVDKSIFDANVNDIEFMDCNHCKRVSEIDLTNEHTFMLNDPYTCYSYVEGKGVKVLKIHTADFSNIVEEGSELEKYIYNCQLKSKCLKNDILSYLKFKEGDTVSAFTYEITFDDNKNTKDIKMYRSKIKVDGDILDYQNNEYVYSNLRRITNDYISKYGDVNISGLSKIEYILKNILQKEYVKKANNNNLPIIAHKKERKEGLSMDLLSNIQNIFNKLPRSDYKRLARLFADPIDEEYYADEVLPNEEYDLNITGTPNYIFLLNQRMIKELLNRELCFDPSIYKNQKQKMKEGYSDLMNKLNDILDYKSEADFDYKIRRNFKTYILRND